MTMCYSPENKVRGFTLVELLIAMAIGCVVLGALISTFVIQSKAYDVQEQVAEMVQSARAAMDMMTREIRMAGYNPTGATFNGITYDAAQLQIRADLSGDGDTGDSNENIVYKYYGATDYQIKRKTGGGYFQPFAENIQAFTFAYLEADGMTEVNTTDDNDKIRQIRITITARTAKRDPDYSPNGGYRKYTLTSLITPPNLAY